MIYMTIKNFEVNYNESGDIIISLKEINRAFDAWEISPAFAGMETPDDVSVDMIGRGEFYIYLLWTWEDEEEEISPTWENFKITVRKNYFTIEKMAGTYPAMPCENKYAHTWCIDYEGKLLWEAPLQYRKIRRRPCRK